MADEKKIIFSKFALPKVLKRMSLKEDECVMTEEALDAVKEGKKITEQETVDRSEQMLLLHTFL